MLVIGSEFDPTACIPCEVRFDCAAARMAEKIGSTIIQRGWQAESEVGRLITDLVVLDDVADEEEFADRLTHATSGLWEDVEQLRGEFSEFLQRSSEIVFSFVDGDVQDEMGLTRARDGILQLLNEDYPAVRQVGIQSKEMLAGILALERHEPTAICGAVELSISDRA